MRIRASVWNRWSSWLCVGAWTVCGGTWGIARADEPTEVETRSEVQVIVTTSDGESTDRSSGERTDGDHAEEKTAGKHSAKAERGDGGEGESESRPRWLGVQMGQVPEMLRKHLKLGENEGVLVISVMPKSPGEQAGLETHDVIVQLGEARVEGPGSLSKLVQESEGEVVLTVIRAGDRQSVRVEPAPWPNDLPRDVLRATADGAEVNLQKMIIQGLGPIIVRHPGEGGAEGRAELHLELRDDQEGPGVVLPGGQPQFDVLVSPAPEGRETKVGEKELRADRLFFVNPGGGGPMRVMPLPPGNDPGRWDRLEKSLDRLNGVLERLEKKLGD